MSQEHMHEANGAIPAFTHDHDDANEPHVHYVVRRTAQQVHTAWRLPSDELDGTTTGVGSASAFPDA